MYSRDRKFDYVGERGVSCQMFVEYAKDGELVQKQRGCPSIGAGAVYDRIEARLMCTQIQTVS